MLSSLVVGTIANRSGPVVSLVWAGAILDTRLDPADASSGISLEADGDIVQIDSEGNTDIGDWITPKSAAGVEYEARLSVNSGTTPAGSATATWLALSSTRSWSLSQTVIGTDTCNVTLEIRQAAGGAVLATKTFDITATVS